jgi:hypothetical protein
VIDTANVTDVPFVIAAVPYTLAVKGIVKVKAASTTTAMVGLK